MASKAGSMADEVVAMADFLFYVNLYYLVQAVLCEFVRASYILHRLFPRKNLVKIYSDLYWVVQIHIVQIV
jgi:hypothetical protein